MGLKIILKALNRHFFKEDNASGQQACEKMYNIISHQGNTNYNNNKMSPIRIAKIETKKLTPPNGDQDAEKLNHLYIVNENVKCYSHSGKQLGNFLKTQT